MKTDWKTGNRIGYEGAKSLSESLGTNTSLTELNLGSDEKCFEKRIAIKGLRLDNEIGDQGLESLSEMMKINSSLTALDLSGFFLKSIERECGNRCPPIMCCEDGQ